MLGLSCRLVVVRSIVGFGEDDVAGRDQLLSPHSPTKNLAVPSAQLVMRPHIGAPSVGVKGRRNCAVGFRSLVGWKSRGPVD